MAIYKCDECGMAFSVAEHVTTHKENDCMWAKLNAPKKSAPAVTKEKEKEPKK